MSSVKIVLIKSSKDDDYGYLKVRVIKNRQPKYKSLKIKIKEKNWNANKQTVTFKEVRHKEINEKIKETLEKLAQYNSQLSSISTSNKTILVYYDETISTTINIGSRIKYQGARDKFERFLNSIGETDIYFHELTEFLVKKFFKYIRDNGCSANTTNYQINSLKTITNRAIDSGLVSYVNNPFASIKLKYEKKQKVALTKSEIQKIIEKESFNDSRIQNRYKKENCRRFVSLEEYRDIFIFQLNMQGMRCSDMQLLRWKNLKVINGLLMCNFSMFKTGKEMTMVVTPLALQNMRYSIYNIAPELENIIVKHEEKKKQILLDASKFDDKKDIDKINNAEDKYSNISAEIYKLLAITAFQIAQDDNGKNLFVFPFLKHEDFKMYDNKSISNLDNIQYKRLIGTRHYYNKLLKVIQEQCNIHTSISSHIARHSYSTLLIENNASITELSATLGHSNISTTQKYISRLNLSNISELNNELSKMFYQ